MAFESDASGWKCWPMMLTQIGPEQNSGGGGRAPSRRGVWKWVRREMATRLRRID